MIVDFGVSYIKKLAAAKVDFLAAGRPIIKVGDHLSNQYILLGSELRRGGGLGKCISILNASIECTS